MSVSAAGAQHNRRVLMIVSVAIVAIIAVVAIVLVARGGNDDTTVPPLTAAEKQAGAVRVSYPDRSLPAQPEKVVVGDATVSLYFVSVDGTGDNATAVLRVASDARPGGTPTEVTLQEAHATSVDGVVLTLLAVHDTGDLSSDAADVTVTAQ